MVRLGATVPHAAPPGQTFVMLRPGYSTRRIATELQKAGVIRSKEAFILWHYLPPQPFTEGRRILVR